MVYRPFAPGAGYLLGLSAVSLLLQQSSLVDLEGIPEDVYIGEVMYQLGLQPTQLPGFFTAWQLYCDAGRDSRWAIIHWLWPDKMVSYLIC